MGGHAYNTFGYDFENRISCNKCNHQWNSTLTGRTAGANNVVMELYFSEDSPRKNFNLMLKYLRKEEVNCADFECIKYG